MKCDEFPAKTAPSYTSEVFGDIDRFCEAVSAVDVELTQLSAGKLSIIIDQIDLGDVIVSRQGTSGDLYYSGALQHGWTSISLLQGSASKEMVWCGAYMESDTLFFATDRVPIHVYTPRGWEDYGITIRSELLSELLPYELPTHRAIVHLKPLSSHLLHGVLKHCLELAKSEFFSPDDPSQAIAVRSLVLSALSGAILNSSAQVDFKEKVRLRPGYPTFTAAMDLMDPLASPPITIETLSELSKVGTRSLQRAFAEIVHLSPYQFLIQSKLMAARKELLRQDRSQTIARISAEFGFCSPSDFTARYREMYEESPSATRRRLA